MDSFNVCMGRFLGRTGDLVEAGKALADAAEREGLESSSIRLLIFILDENRRQMAKLQADILRAEVE